MNKGYQASDIKQLKKVEEANDRVIYLGGIAGKGKLL